MKALAAAVLLTCSTASFAANCTGPDGVVLPSARCERAHTPRTPTVAPAQQAAPTPAPTLTASPNLTNGATSSSESDGGSASVTVLTSSGAAYSEAPRQAPQAPDIISYPTAPCRIAGGVSASWLGGSAGVSGSVQDENCARIETSRHLHNLGQQQAAVQVMCLSADAKQALEAVGVKCLISAPVAADGRVTP